MCVAMVSHVQVQETKKNEVLFLQGKRKLRGGDVIITKFLEGPLDWRRVWGLPLQVLLIPVLDDVCHKFWQPYVEQICDLDCHASVSTSAEWGSQQV